MKRVVNGALVPAAPGGMTELPDGAGVFETVLIREGAPVFLAEHWVRFAAGCRWHGLALPTAADELAGFALQLAKENRVHTGVLRFAAWRHDNRIVWRVEVGPPRPHMARARLRVAAGGPVLPLATPDRACKQLNRGVWGQALREARAAGWDEVLLGDLAGRLVEGGGANVFFVTGGILHTPSLAVGPLPGVMRAQILALTRAHGRPVAELAGRKFDSTYPVLHRLREAWREEHDWDPLVIVNTGH
jgi:branched-subunit amino acid aminotransferase/4-amino-4-deoxychorismate lyase